MGVEKSWNAAADTTELFFTRGVLARALCLCPWSLHPPKALSFLPLEANYISTVSPSEISRLLEKINFIRSQEVFLLFSPMILIPRLSCHSLLICRERASIWEIVKIIIIGRVVLTEMEYGNTILSKRPWLKRQSYFCSVTQTIQLIQS